MVQSQRLMYSKYLLHILEVVKWKEAESSLTPSGGPMIVVGGYLEEAEAVVKSIDFTVGYGYTVTFE